MREKIISATLSGDAEARILVRQLRMLNYGNTLVLLALTDFFKAETIIAEAMRERLMKDLILACAIVLAMFTQANASGPPCSAAVRFDLQLADRSIKDYHAYDDEGQTTLAAASMINAKHSLDLANADGYLTCSSDNAMDITYAKIEFDFHAYKYENEEVASLKPSYLDDLWSDMRLLWMLHYKNTNAADYQERARLVRLYYRSAGVPLKTWEKK